MVWCQNEINHVEYSISLNKSKDNNESYYSMLIQNLDSKMKQMKFDLFFSDKVSKFSLKDSLNNPDENEIILEIAGMLGKEYYSKVNCDTVFAKNARFRKFKNRTCFSILKKDWVITSETKRINGFTCFKAFTSINKDFGDGDTVKDFNNLTAWFCPEIKSSFGTQCYNGLPGLILELEQKLVVFKAIKTDYKEESRYLTLPLKSIVSEAELYNSIYKN